MRTWLSRFSAALILLAFSTVAAAQASPLTLTVIAASEDIQQSVTYTAAPFLRAEGGETGDYVFEVIGALPSGITLDPDTGTISGRTCDKNGQAFWTARVSDGAESIDLEIKTNVVRSPERGACTTVAAGDPGPSVNLFIAAPGALDTPVAEDTIEATAGFTFSRAYAGVGGTGPYTYLLEGPYPPGVTVNDQGVLSGRVAIPGTYVFDLVLEDDDGFDYVTRITLIVGERPDPSQDPNVVGLINAQLASSARFADMQSDAVSDRLSASRECLKSGAKINSPVPLPLDFKSENCSDVAAWASLSFGKGGNATDGSAFTNPNVTVGVDKRLAPAALVGLAVGYGSDRTDINGGGAQLKGSASSLTVYGSYKLQNHLQLDGLLGGLKTSFDSRRSIVSEELTLTGKREGSQVYGRVRLSVPQQIGAFRFTPYGFLERGSGTLDAYTETGDDMLALNFDAADYSYNRFAAGFRLAQRFATSSGALEPSLTLEQRRTTNSSVTQVMSYVDLPDDKYTLVTNPLSRNASALKLGLTYHSASGVNTSLGYSFTKGSGQLLQRVLGINVTVPLK